MHGHAICGCAIRSCRSSFAESVALPLFGPIPALAHPGKLTGRGGPSLSSSSSLVGWPRYTNPHLHAWAARRLARHEQVFCLSPVCRSTSTSRKDFSASTSFYQVSRLSRTNIIIRTLATLGSLVEREKEQNDKRGMARHFVHDRSTTTRRLRLCQCRVG